MLNYEQYKNSQRFCLTYDACGYPPLAKKTKTLKTRPVFLDLSIGGTAARLTFELRKDIAPLTVENFRLLCTGDRGTHNGGTPLSYLGCIFHRVVKDFAVMGGDIANQDGTGRLSVYGEPFVDENFILWHVGPGVLTCCNAGPNTNTSAFMITTVEAPWLNGHCVVFGCLADAASFEALDKMEACGTEGGRPSVDIQVTACGQLFPF
ncbi:unnamed protein product [Ascophyllum nodosum]